MFLLGFRRDKSGEGREGKEGKGRGLVDGVDEVVVDVVLGVHRLDDLTILDRRAGCGRPCGCKYMSR